MPIDDRIRAPLPCEARTPDRRVDGVRGLLLGVKEADVAVLAVRVFIIRPPPPLALERALSSLTVQSP